MVEKSIGDVILITGGAGSLGRRLAEEFMKPVYGVKAIRIFDNNENGLARFKRETTDPALKLRWLLGDIRDHDRIQHAMEGVTTCFHCAALKHVDFGEFNPFEQIKTNVLGTKNVIEAALHEDIDKLLVLSSDKAVQACSTYGRCKALCESLTLDANHYKGDRRVKLSVARPPNYFGSAGSVTEIWEYQRSQGLPLTVTDKRMVRYFIEFDAMITFLVSALSMMRGGEIFVPTNCKLVRIYDFAKTFNTEIKLTGLRPGERLEEILLDPSEEARAQTLNDMWIVR